MAELVDLKWVSYRKSDFEGFKGKLPTIIVVRETPELVHARSEGYEIGMKIGLNNEILAKCTCEKYDQGSPCKHMVAVFQRNFKDKIFDEEEVEDVEKTADELMKMLEGEEEVEEKKEEEKKGEVRMEDKFAKFANEIRGRLTVLFGAPLTGKSTLAHLITKHFDRTIYFRVDKNFTQDMFRSIAKNVQYIDIKSPKHLLYQLNDLLKNPPRNSLIVVDSLTSLDSYFVPDDPTKQSPLSDKLRARFADAVMQKLSMLKDLGNTVLTIAHERIRSFDNPEPVPRFNIVALRHSDLIYRLSIENNRRVVKKVAERKIVEKLDFDFS